MGKKCLVRKGKTCSQEDGLTDYDVYIMGKQERILTIIFAAIVLFAVGYVFIIILFYRCCLLFCHLSLRIFGRNRLFEKKKSADFAI